MRKRSMEHPLQDMDAWMKETLALCTAFEPPSRESRFIREQFEKLAQANGITRKNELDRLVFERMYGRKAEKNTDSLTIRYWRTGRHKPQSREQCLALGRSLDLGPEDMRFLIQGYYDSADQIFSSADQKDPVYLKRRKQIETLAEQYLAMAHPLELERLKISWKNPALYLRHYYVQDAKQYVSSFCSSDPASHLGSTNYVSEFQKNRFLQGEPPRKTMLRHLFLMQSPFLSRELLSQGLQNLGYLPLDPEHESRGGARLDLLVIRLLTLYEQECSGKSPSACRSWLRRTCRTIDEFLVKSRHPELRFLHFKLLDEA